MPSQIKDAGLRFHPRAGTLLMCDFRGMVPPEINKRRPVIVVTPRLQYRDRMATVVPTSTSEPKHPQPYHVELSRNYFPGEDPTKRVWAKADLVCSVSFERLDRFMLGPRRYEAPMISTADLEAVRQGILSGLGFVNLTATERPPT